MCRSIADQEIELVFVSEDGVVEGRSSWEPNPFPGELDFLPEGKTPSDEG